MKYKKGDKVFFSEFKVLGSWGEYWHGRYELNKEYKVDSLGDYDFNISNTNCVCLENFHVWIPEDAVRPISELKPIVYKSLVGRYVKALVNCPNGGVVKEGEIACIYLDDEENYDKAADFPSQHSYSINSRTLRDGKSYELMPEGWKPEEEYKDDKGRVLKTFKVGEWYTNPDHSRIPKYCRISSCVVSKVSGYHYNSLKFDAVADENWKVTLVDEAQSNTDYDQNMIYVVKPEDLLEEAKKRYPIGTKYKCAAGGTILTVEKQSFTKIGKDTIHAESGKGCLFYDGKWAEIVSEDETYNIGDWVLATGNISGYENKIGKYVEFKKWAFDKYVVEFNGAKLHSKIHRKALPSEISGIFEKKLDISNTKIWIGDNPELSKRVQEKAFELGWGWNQSKNKVSYTDKTSLHFWEDKEICYSDGNKADFDGGDKKEIFPEDLGLMVQRSHKASEYPLTPMQAYSIVTEIVQCTSGEIELIRPSKKLMTESVNPTKSTETQLIKSNIHFLN